MSNDEGLFNILDVGDGSVEGKNAWQPTEDHDGDPEQYEAPDMLMTGSKGAGGVQQ